METNKTIPMSHYNNEAHTKYRWGIGSNYPLFHSSDAVIIYSQERSSAVGNTTCPRETPTDKTKRPTLPEPHRSAVGMEMTFYGVKRGGASATLGAGVGRFGPLATQMGQHGLLLGWNMIVTTAERTKLELAWDRLFQTYDYYRVTMCQAASPHKAATSY
ncbi:hypothetical protein M434DRAFT_307411 [Hypoxylon sp. CO27-5]|nr:hypothetical protein M434DRAFT_307411 [Hypoxylon sp. CO27-5]